MTVNLYPIETMEVRYALAKKEPEPLERRLMQGKVQWLLNVEDKLRLHVKSSDVALVFLTYKEAEDFLKHHGLSGDYDILRVPFQTGGRDHTIAIDEAIQLRKQLGERFGGEDR